MIYKLETQSEMTQGRLNFGYLKYEKDSYLRLLALMIKRYSIYIISVAFLSICCTKYFMVKPPAVAEVCEFHHVKNLSPIFVFYLTPKWIDNKLYFIGLKRGCEKDTLCLCTYDLKSKEWRFTDLGLDATFSYFWDSLNVFALTIRTTCLLTPIDFSISPDERYLIYTIMEVPLRVESGLLRANKEVYKIYLQKLSKKMSHPKTYLQRLDTTSHSVLLFDDNKVALRLCWLSPNKVIFERRSFMVTATDTVIKYDLSFDGICMMDLKSNRKKILEEANKEHILLGVLPDSATIFFVEFQNEDRRIFSMDTLGARRELTFTDTKWLPCYVLDATYPSADIPISYSLTPELRFCAGRYLLFYPEFKDDKFSGIIICNTKNARRKISPHCMSPVYAISPDGNNIAFFTWTEDETRIHIYDCKEQVLSLIENHP
ncbi:hypothetical protein DRO02_07190 [archaeon]|nr:MAG: hypothetical protein DRO02_07190 [archaeon]